MTEAGGLSLARCSGISERDVSEYFSLLWETVEKFCVMNKRERVWNAEESGCQLNNRLTTKKKVRLEGKRSRVSKTSVNLVNLLLSWLAQVLMWASFHQWPCLEGGSIVQNLEEVFQAVR
jgi:hypothetical protein